MSKRISTIKKQQYRGLRSDIAKELNVSVWAIDNAMRGKNKDALFLAKVRSVATLLLEKREKELKSIS